MTSLLAHRGYVRLWVARVAGTAGQQMFMVALGWQIYDLTGSAWDLGLVGLLQFLPALLLALVAGHVVDRHQRAHGLATCLACYAAIAAILFAGSFLGLMRREWILAISVALGALRAFQMPAQQSLTPSLVPYDLLPRALAFSASGMQAAIIVGPALGGAFYVGGAHLTYGACFVLFVIAAGVCATIRYEHVPPAGSASWATMLAGLRFVATHKVVLGAVTLDLFAVLLGGASALLPIYARDILHTGPVGLGILRGAPAVGALLMSLLLTRWPIRRRTGRTLLAAVAIYGLSMIVFGWSTSFAVSLVALAASGSADMVSVVIRQTLVQLETPDDMRGRVSAVNSMFIGASNQLGEFESGATAAWFGPVGSVVVGGVGTCLVAAAWLRLFPELAARDRLVRAPAAVPPATSPS